MANARIDEIFDIDSISKQIISVKREIESLFDTIAGNVKQMQDVGDGITKAINFKELEKNTEPFLRISINFKEQQKQLIKLKDQEAELDARLSKRYLELFKSVETYRQEVSEETKLNRILV